MKNSNLYCLSYVEATLEPLTREERHQLKFLAIIDAPNIEDILLVFDDSTKRGAPYRGKIDKLIMISGEYYGNEVSVISFTSPVDTKIHCAYLEMTVPGTEETFTYSASSEGDDALYPYATNDHDLRIDVRANMPDELIPRQFDFIEGENGRLDVIAVMQDNKAYRNIGIFSRGAREAWIQVLRNVVDVKRIEIDGQIFQVEISSLDGGVIINDAPMVIPNFHAEGMTINTDRHDQILLTGSQGRYALIEIEQGVPKLIGLSQIDLVDRRIKPMMGKHTSIGNMPGMMLVIQQPGRLPMIEHCPIETPAA